METAAAWGPGEFQLANWTVHEPGAQVWAPPACVPMPMEYASIDIFGNSCSLQGYVPDGSSGGLQQQLVEYYYSAALQHSGKAEVIDLPNREPMVSDESRASCVLNHVTHKFKSDINMMKEKMHRYPACLGAVDESYTVPRIVAIGPYHRDRIHLLMEGENAKSMAVCHCIRQSGCPMMEVYGAVASAADDARCLYHKDVMAGISYQDFRDMMFLDACFLVQYMLMRGGIEIDVSLRGFLSPNRVDIFHDVMLLENQLPWKVVETVMSFMRVSSLPERFVRSMRHCMLPDYFELEELKQQPFYWDDSYDNPPHLLGLLRYYIVGRSKGTKYPTPKTKNILFSMSAIKLDKIGIRLTANKTMKLIDMRLDIQGTGLFPKLSLAPLSLDHDCASYLVNMAAFELCTVKSFGNAGGEEHSAVCSYLTLLAMLVCREEDVHQLRERDILQGGGGLTNEEALRFITSLQGMRLGPCYIHIMRQIESYREKRWVQAWLYEFYYNYGTIVLAAIGAIGTLAGIIASIMSHMRG
ncbi:unnamed protein product [Urochloa decumbens]|uniref:Uncharacterized protein n=1 Tax=Urochloa decumbens TaxID=240449 RepID=A0ABC9B1Y5_9POAL